MFFPGRKRIVIENISKVSLCSAIIFLLIMVGLLVAGQWVAFFAVLAVLSGMFFVVTILKIEESDGFVIETNQCSEDN